MAELDEQLRRYATWLAESADRRAGPSEPGGQLQVGPGPNSTAGLRRSRVLMLTGAAAAVAALVVGLAVVQNDRGTDSTLTAAGASTAPPQSAEVVKPSESTAASPDTVPPNSGTTSSEATTATTVELPGGPLLDVFLPRLFEAMDDLGYVSVGGDRRIATSFEEGFENGDGKYVQIGGFAGLVDPPGDVTTTIGGDGSTIVTYGTRSGVWIVCGFAGLSITSQSSDGMVELGASLSDLLGCPSDPAVAASETPDTTVLPTSTIDPPEDGNLTPTRPLVAITGDGDAVFFDASDGTPTVLLDGADPDTIDTTIEGPGPNVIDSVAVSQRTETGFVGECCEPVSGIVHVSQISIPVDKNERQQTWQGYGVSVSPAGDRMAVGNFAGVDVGIEVLDIAAATSISYRSEEQTPFSPYETMWADDSTVVLLGVGTTGWELAVFDLESPASTEPRIISLSSSNGANSRLSLAGHPVVGTIGIYEQGGKEVYLVDVFAEAESVLTAAAVELPGEALSAWFLDPGQLIWVDVDRTLRVGDVVVPGVYTWARR